MDAQSLWEAIMRNFGSAGSDKKRIRFPNNSPAVR